MDFVSLRLYYYYVVLIYIELCNCATVRLCGFTSTRLCYSHCVPLARYDLAVLIKWLCDTDYVGCTTSTAWFYDSDSMILPLRLRVPAASRLLIIYVYMVLWLNCSAKLKLRGSTIPWLPQSILLELFNPNFIWHFCLLSSLLLPYVWICDHGNLWSYNIL